MSRWYAIFLCFFINTSLYAQEKTTLQGNQENLLKTHVGRVFMCALATVYKHPFMSCWSIYSTFFPAQIIFEDSQSRRVLTQPRGLFTWLIDTLLLGDFAHNMLHAYKVKHHPCIKDVCYCASMQDDNSQSE